MDIRQLTAMLEAASDGIALFDADERLVLVNGKFKQLFGGTAGLMVPGVRYEALLRQAVAIGENPDLGEQDPEGYVAERLRRFRNPADPFEFPLPDGRWILVSDHKAADGSTVCIRTDITEMKRREAALKESEQRYRQLVDVSPEGIVVFDQRGWGRFVNAAGRQVLGLPDGQDPRTLHVMQFMPPPVREAATATLPKVLAGEAVRQVRTPVRRLDGAELMVELSAVPFQDGGERLVLCLLRDVTEESVIRREVAEKTRILEAMMDSVGIGIEVYDADGRLLVANRRLTEVLDLPEDLLRPGTRDRDVLKYLAEHGEYPEETVEESLADYDRIRERGVFFSERRRPNGKWLQVRHFPMPGGGYVALFADVTEQKMLQAQLLQSQKMEALGQLAGGIAHDFNNILSVIGGYAGMAREMAGRDSDIAQPLAKVVQGVQRAAALTRELLTFSRHKVAEARTVDLGAVVRGQEFLLKPLLGATIELDVALPEGPVWVDVDPDMAAQALVNLAINARDAMPGGGPLSVRLASADPGETRPAGLEGDFAVLSVTDRGFGMSEEVRARIFEPFFTTKPPGQGTGLGLSMVYGLMKQAGGAVQVDSAPARGTTFRLWFPLAPAPAEAPCAPLDAQAAGSGRSATILVAEDEPDILDLVRAALETAGHRVVTASDGVEALERFEEGGIDLLVTDLIMPSLGGARLAHLVTELDPDVQVVFMTGYPGRGDAAPADLPRDAVILYKPLDLETLAATVDRLLARAPAHAAP